jgi:RNA-directed DNA polymerase
MLDRAKQMLAKLALEPEWEAVFEPNSYGFRPSRSCHDAIEALFLNLHHNIPKFVFDADITKCFDRIDHEALLQKIDSFPEMKTQIRA